MKRTLVISLVAVTVSALVGVPIDAPASKQGTTKISEPVRLPRLFNVPTAGVLGSLDVYLTGGGAFGADKERYFLGRCGIGLGDVAEVEVSTWAVINTLKRSSSNIPTSAFKMRILQEKEDRPAVAWALRGTTSWQDLSNEETGASFQTRLTKLHVVATKSAGSFFGHAGLGLTDVRVKDPRGWEFTDPNEEELQKNLLAPFVGFSVRANPKTLVMGEIDGVPQYKFTMGKKHGSDAIKNVWAGAIGVRFYFSNTVATDAGVRYRSDFDGIADANIQASMNLLLPLSRFPRKS